MTHRRARAGARAVSLLGERLADQHLPRRPEWECQVCPAATSWPCPPAQVKLAEAYGRDRVGLAMYVGTLLWVATGERPQDDPTELYERIVGWIR